MKRCLLDNLGFMGFDLTIRKRAGYLKYIRNQKVLDIGCGDNGYIAYLLYRQGNEVMGIDKRKEAVESSRRMHPEIQFEQINLNDLRMLNMKFDIVVCMEVIEHIIEDKQLLRNIHSKLNDGGKLLLTTINSSSKNARETRVSKTEDGGHIRAGYSKGELDLILTEAGFKVEECSSCVGRITQEAILLEQRARELNNNILFRAVLFGLLYPFAMLDSSRDKDDDMTLVFEAVK